MRCFKKISFKKLSLKKLVLKNLSASCLLMLLVIICPLSFAAGSNIDIKTAEIQLQDNHYTLEADININFDKEIEEAINKGVPLNFVVEFQIVRPRKYWFDDEVITTTRNITLSYHALTRQYLVNRGVHQQSFETLAEATQAMMDLSDWKVVDKLLLEKNDVYRAALLVRLDQTKLPKAIQVDALSSEKWNLSSEKYVWALKELASKELNNKEINNKEINNKDPNNKDFNSKEPTKDSATKELPTKELPSKELPSKELPSKEPKP